MLTPIQFQRKYPCPCTEDGVKCKLSFRYLFNLKAHILKEHRFTPEWKKLIKKKWKYYKEYHLKRKNLKQDEQELTKTKKPSLTPLKTQKQRGYVAI